MARRRAGALGRRRSTGSRAMPTESASSAHRSERHTNRSTTPSTTIASTPRTSIGRSVPRSARLRRGLRPIFLVLRDRAPRTLTPSPIRTVYPGKVKAPPRPAVRPRASAYARVTPARCPAQSSGAASAPTPRTAPGRWRRCAAGPRARRRHRNRNSSGSEAGATSSGMPPVRAPITGMPRARASLTTSGAGSSHSDGTTSASISSYSASRAAAVDPPPVVDPRDAGDRVDVRPASGDHEPGVRESPRARTPAPACGCPSPRSPDRGTRTSVVCRQRARVASPARAPPGCRARASARASTATPLRAAGPRPPTRRARRREDDDRAARSGPSRWRGTTGTARCTAPPRPSPSCCADTAASSRGACARARSRVARCASAPTRSCSAPHGCARRRAGRTRARGPSSDPRPAARRHPRGTPVAARGLPGVLADRVSPRSDLRDDVVAGDTGRRARRRCGRCSAAAPRAPRRRAPRRRAPRVATGWRPSAPARRRTLQARDRPGADRSHRRSPCHHRCASACWPTPSTTPVGSGATCARSSPRAVGATTSSSWSPSPSRGVATVTDLVGPRLAGTLVAPRDDQVSLALWDRHRAGRAFEAAGVDVVIGCKHLVPRTRIPRLLVVHDVLTITRAGRTRSRSACCCRPSSVGRSPTPPAWWR